MDADKSPLRLIVRTALLLCFVALAYFAAYFAVGKRGTISGPKFNGDAQFFSNNVEVVFFTPAAKIESLVRGETVYVVDWDVPAK